MRWCAWVLLLGGCAARGPQIPGPLRALAWARPEDATRLPSARPPEAPEDRALSADRAASRSAGRTPPASPYGESIARAAAWYLDHPTTGFRSDCSGFVEASTARASVPHRGSTRDLWSQLEARGDVHRRQRPSPGDLAFFDNTYDRDDDGLVDDPLTHVAVVVSVDADGTIHMAHDGTSRGRTTLRMNLLHPRETRGPDGEVWNEALRARRDGEAPNTPHLASELWRGFGVISGR
jgi:hypothetical protein